MAIELLDPETQNIVDKVEKMLRLAANNPNPEERARAEEKAHAWLAKYNLDMATIEQHGGTENGRRAEENMKGGYFDYQRDLWRAVAELNFCMYWNQIAFVKERKFLPNPQLNGFRRHEVTRRENQHRLVGRIHNVILTRTMSEYIEHAIERAVVENISGDQQRRGTYANSLRRGMFERVVERIYTKRREMIAEEEQKARDAEIAAREAGKGEHSTGRGLTLASLAQAEEDANKDFIMGEDGYSARMRKEAAERRAARAEAARQADEEWTQWCADNPEEAARMAAEQVAEERKRQKRRNRYVPRGRYNYSPRDDVKGDAGAHYAGRELGNKISIDAQTGRDKSAGSLR